MASLVDYPHPTRRNRKSLSAPPHTKTTKTTRPAMRTAERRSKRPAQSDTNPVRILEQLFYTNRKSGRKKSALEADFFILAYTNHTVRCGIDYTRTNHCKAHLTCGCVESAIRYEVSGGLTSPLAMSKTAIEKSSIFRHQFPTLRLIQHNLMSPQCKNNLTSGASKIKDFRHPLQPKPLSRIAPIEPLNPKQRSCLTDQHAHPLVHACRSSAPPSTGLNNLT
jgi:hypothetical protein